MLNLFTTPDRLRAGLAAAALTLAGCAAKKPPTPPTDDRLGSINDQLKARFESEDRLSGHVGSAAGHVEDIRKELRR